MGASLVRGDPRKAIDMAQGSQKARLPFPNPAKLSPARLDTGVTCFDINMPNLNRKEKSYRSHAIFKANTCQKSPSNLTQRMGQIDPHNKDVRTAIFLLAH
uniref:hypothetical protein n=1 Tax=uncultured Caulobacter sp. TaxID=158749 RepID=UPI0025D66263|nr:hypothetical protein [uncultured Caulobacter sp.]